MAGFTDKFSVRVKKEIIKIKEMKGFKEKISYIADYYKIPIIATIAGIIAIISLVRSIQSNNYETSLYVSYVNCISVDLRDETKILDNTLTNWLGIDGVKQRVSVDGYYKVDPSTYSEETFTSAQKLNIMIAAKSSDCYFGDELFTGSWANSGCLRNLEDVLPPELLEKVRDRLVYYPVGETGEEFAVGVDLAGLPFVTELLVFSNEHPIFSIVTNAPHVENCITMLENILNYR